MYLAVSSGAVSLALVREEDDVQWPIYHTSKYLLNAKTRYQEIEKLGPSPHGGCTKIKTLVLSPHHRGANQVPVKTSLSKN